MREGLRIWTTYTNAWKNHPRADQASFWATARPFDLAHTIAAMSDRKMTFKVDGAVEYNPAKDKVLPAPPGKTPSSRRIVFSRPLEEIRAVSTFLFDKEDEKPGAVGDRCFEIVRGQERRSRISCAQAKRLISNMVCIEELEAAHLRQVFNKPIQSINCVHTTLEDYLAQTAFTEPIILWLDYTKPKHLRAQIESFSEQALILPVGSVVRLTVNASPSSLGEPADKNQNVREWRLKKFKDRMTGYYSASAVPDDMSPQRYGECVLRAVQLAVEKAILGAKDREIFWTLAITYADGQGMATATLLILKRRDPLKPGATAKPGETPTAGETPTGETPTPEDRIRALIRDWEFFSEPRTPLVLDMPNLSTLERLTMEALDDPQSRMKFELPKSEIGQDPFDAFKKFYRVFPHFTRVQL